MSEVRIATEPRNEFGKGASRRLRRNQQVPGVVYGHGTDPVHISLPGRELTRALSTSGVLLELELAAGLQLALPKSVQRDPIKHTIEHIDLVIIERGEIVTVEVPVVAEGKLVPGGLLEYINDRIAVNADATQIPAQLTISVEGMTIGDSIHAGQVALPDGVTLAADPEMNVVQVTSGQIAEEPEEELEGVEGEEGVEGVEGAEGAEGESGAGAADES
ncbi:MAG TPA: 50S ribosomal protein L25/general stress protein Ctc [Acidimicrobiia bacterium]|nr:50S ribosomal protein L25/general stress protein Ctc [Acidimicrobiia bacterium]